MAHATFRVRKHEWHAVGPSQGLLGVSLCIDSSQCSKSLPLVVVVAAVVAVAVTIRENALYILCTLRGTGESRWCCAGTAQSLPSPAAADLFRNSLNAQHRDRPAARACTKLLNVMDMSKKQRIAQNLTLVMSPVHQPGHSIRPSPRQARTCMPLCTAFQIMDVFYRVAERRRPRGREVEVAAAWPGVAPRLGLLASSECTSVVFFPQE
eukprot:233210-Chlamydomonas_euryale.AAC.3